MLQEIKLPQKITGIGENAFRDCLGITSIEVPDGVTSIGGGAFSGCSGLKSIMLPFVGGSANADSASASTLFGYIFGTVSYPGGTAVRQYYSNTASTAYYIPDTLKSVRITGGKILYGSFEGCSNLESIHFSTKEKTTDIGAKAFSGCTGLKDLMLPDVIKTIGNYAFSGCTGLDTIPQGDGLETIGSYAFQNCSNVKSVTLPETVTVIGAAAFSGCSSLQSMTLPFVGGSSDLTSASAKSLFGYIFGTKKYTGSIAVKQYYSASGTSTCYIPESMKKVVITGGSNILYGAFSNCSGLDRITLPKELTGIGQKAFYYCTGLTEITIPQNVTSIASSAFEGCTGMQCITFSGNAPSAIATNAFKGDTLTVYYPVSDPTWTEDIRKDYGGKLDWQLHSHTYQSVVTAPTCTEQGYTTYQCKYCNSSYVNDYTSALGHVPVTDEAVQETCTSEGLTEGSHCSVCGAVIVAQTEIPKTSHHFTEFVSKNDATYDADGTMTAACSKCGTVETVIDPGSRLPDHNKPSVEILLGTNRWTDILNTITFGLFFKDTQTVVIHAEDNEILPDGNTVSRLDSVYYYLSDKEIPSDQLDSVSWNIYTGELRLNPDKKYIIYTKAVDRSGNTSYASSSGLIIDDKPPVIDGISDGAVYCEKAVFKVTDLSLQSVMDNGTAITSSTGIYTITGDDVPHTITAVDDCGNKTNVIIVVNKNHKWEEPAFLWSDDYKSCTAEYVCMNDDSHSKEIVCNVRAESPDADCVTAGEVTFTATAVLDGIERTDLKKVSGAVLGHDYAAEFTWTEDYSSCTAEFTCQRAGCSSDTAGHVLSGLECMVETRTTSATCIMEGKRSVTARIMIEGVEYTEDGITEIIPVDPDHHTSLRILGYKEETATENGYTGDTWCGDCGNVVEYGFVIPATGQPEGPDRPTPTPEPGNPENPTPTPKPGNSENPAPIPEPGNSEKPVPTQSGYTTSSLGNRSDTGDSGSGKDDLAVGAIFVSGNIKYKIASTARGSLAVTVKEPSSSKVKSLTIPATVRANGKSYKVTSIAANAFKNCSKLEKITIGKNVAAIGGNAFYKAKVLKKIVIRSTKVKSVGKNVWKGIYKKAVIRVPKKKLTMYKKMFKNKGQKKTVRIVKG